MPDQVAIDYDAGMTEGERLVLSCIPYGRKFARSVATLAEMTGIEHRQVEKTVRRLITQHNVCIGSSSGRPFGYYLITAPEEIDKVYTSLRRRGLQVLMRAAKLKKISLEEVFGQGRII